jgi:hypothetical protein
LALLLLESPTRSPEKAIKVEPRRLRRDLEKPLAIMVVNVNLENALLLDVVKTGIKIFKKYSY